MPGADRRRRAFQSRHGGRGGAGCDAAAYSSGVRGQPGVPLTPPPPRRIPTPPARKANSYSSRSDCAGRESGRRRLAAAALGGWAGGAGAVGGAALGSRSGRGACRQAAVRVVSHGGRLPSCSMSDAGVVEQEECQSADENLPAGNRGVSCGGEFARLGADRFRSVENDASGGLRGHCACTRDRLRVVAVVDACYRGRAIRRSEASTLRKDGP